MSSNAASSPRLCPECGARNSGFSLFCAECGTSLNTASRTTADDDQTTTTFRPIPSDPGQQTLHAEPAQDAYITREFVPQAISPSGTAVAPPIGWGEYEVDDPYPPVRTESRRGFVLGLIAATLIALVIAFFLWSTVADQGFRDAVTGLFG